MRVEPAEETEEKTAIRTNGRGEPWRNRARAPKTQGQVKTKQRPMDKRLKDVMVEGRQSPSRVAGAGIKEDGHLGKTKWGKKRQAEKHSDGTQGS